jgi:serine phosphatase RsbU (regulator of sigma subunit)
VTLTERPTPSILVVDDSRLYRTLAFEYLTRAGFRVAEATSGEEGLVAAATVVPDLVLLDMSMPGIDGIETCRRLKASLPTQDVPVIFLSAAGDVEQVVAGFEAGASDYVTKPFRAAELLARVRTHIRLKQLQDERLHLYRQLEGELARAGQVQAEMLALDPPVLSGFQLAARCVPARDVGGDFYSWSELTHGVLKLTVGDVMGKGMPAALLMATVRAAVRAVSQETSPATTVEQVARALQVDFERSGTFVTLFHAQLNEATRRLSYVDAGHGHVFVRRGDGTREQLVGGGLPLGMFPDQDYREGSTLLESGDALIIYSDGLVDARSDGMVDGDVIADRLDGATCASEMVSRLVELAEVSGPPPDDLTVVVLRRGEER